MGPVDRLTPAQREQIREARAQRKIPADLAARTDRGTCLVCGREFALTQTGLVRTHDSDRQARSGRQRCAGSGHRPKEG